MSNTIKFRLDKNGEMKMVSDDILKKIREISPISSLSNDLIIKRPYISKFKNISYSVAPMPILLASTNLSGGSVFWDAFMDYIFPWMLDIAKVFCAIKIAQAFYQERRGGRDESTGFGALVSYGRWLIIFHLLPWGVELIDQLGGTMLSDLKGN